MLTILCALALTQAPADAPNCTAVAKLPTRLAPVWVYPTYFGVTPIAYAQAPAPVDRRNWGITSYAPGRVPVELQRLLRAAEANGGLLARPGLSPRDRYLRDLGRAIDDARAK